MVKNKKNIIPENIYFRSVLPKWALPSLKDTSSHIFKMTIFWKLFGDLMRRFWWCLCKVHVHISISMLNITLSGIQWFLNQMGPCTTTHIESGGFTRSRPGVTHPDKMFHFFTCIFLYYVAHEIIKEFWKNNHFESMRGDFLMRSQNSLQ